MQVGGDSGTTFQWERNDCFHPESVTKRALPPRWVNISGGTVEDTPVYTYFQVDRNSAEAVLDEKMCFLDPTYFIAGNVHNNITLWKRIISDPQVRLWIGRK